MHIEYSYQIMGSAKNSSVSAQNVFQQLEAEEEYYRHDVKSDLAEGFVQHQNHMNYPGLTTCELRVHRSFTMEEQIGQKELYMLSFCLGDGFEWSLPQEGDRKRHIDRQESCIVTGGSDRCISYYEEGQNYKGIGIGIAAEKLSYILEYLNVEKAVKYKLDHLTDKKRYIITPRVEAILYQMAECRLQDGLQKIYLEGKILELLAVYMDEMVCEHGKYKGKAILSREDMASLEQAKEILDRAYVEPPTLTQLSKRICLNEFKLKNGFKERYGTTVYGYVLEKRMTAAKGLLEQGRFRIVDIAGMTGYTNTSHFIQAFQKKYGVTPGIYKKSIFGL